MTNLAHKHYTAVLDMGDAYDAVAPQGMSDESKNIVSRLRRESANYYDALTRGDPAPDAVDPLKRAIEGWQSADRTEKVACAATGRVLQTILDQMLRNATYLAWALPLESGAVSAHFVESIAGQELAFPAHAH